MGKPETELKWVKDPPKKRKVGGSPRIYTACLSHFFASCPGGPIGAPGTDAAGQKPKAARWATAENRTPPELTAALIVWASDGITPLEGGERPLYPLLDFLDVAGQERLAARSELHAGGHGLDR